MLRLLCAAALACTAFAQVSEGPQHSGLDLTAIDNSADPCVDLYQYACGNWVKHNPVPADESSWSRFNELNERNQKILRDILEDSRQHQSRSPLDQKIGAFYGSCMDEAVIERRGTDPLRSELERIAHVSDARQLLEEAARLHQMQVGVFFVFDSTPDPKDASMSIAELDQGGLGLPEKDFYSRTDDKSKDIRQKYVAHVARTFQMIGSPQAEAEQKAKQVMALETSLAAGSLDVTSRRDPQQVIHEMPRGELAQLTPDFNFNEFFTQLRSPDFTKLNVAVPAFFKALNTVLTTSSMADLKDYMTWQYVNASAGRLPKAFVDENFDFYGRTLAGTKELRPRWKRCVSATDDQLGEALGRKFVEKTSGEEAKARTLEMVRGIELQMANDLESLTWMSPPTKKEALFKLHAIANKIGYPEKWRDYSLLNVVADDYFGNWFRGNEFESKRERDKIGKPVDRMEWGMTPPTVNAYYNPLENNINFPAGILQPPFYSVKADDAVDYGAIGVVIGHELTHGFDDEGRQFDASGNLKDWWQKDDEQKFTKLADCFVNEYGAFSPVKGLELNGKLTLGENTADNGGTRLAYFALMDELTKRAIPVSRKEDGYTQQQQFFLGFAQVWCENVTPEQARLWAQTDPHSPGRFRTNGVVTNLPEFSEAFGCKPASQMYAAKGCRVW